MRNFKTLLAIVVFCLIANLGAQENKKPELTEVQKLQIVNASKDVEIWQLRTQQAASEYEKARLALKQIIENVTPKGYQLNEKLELIEIPVDPKK